MDDYRKKSSYERKRKRGKKSLKLYFVLSICCVTLIFLFISFKALNSYTSKNVQVYQHKSNEKLASNKNSTQTSYSKKELNDTIHNKNSNTNKKTAKNSKDDSRSVFADEALKNDGQKIAFLTFDDGPTRNVTPKVLDILKKYDVKATFFVLGQLADQNPDILKKVYEEGHSIGNHSYSHDYKKIYKDVPSFMNEFNKSNESIKNIIGDDYKNELFRFPGGSFEKKKDPFKNKLKEQGFRYIDWNALNGDATGHNIPAEKLLQNVKSTTSGKNHVVILMHDAGTKKTTIEALPAIIEYLKAEGYVFKTLK